jgi:predicted ArsR family transcriptional regulator
MTTTGGRIEGTRQEILNILRRRGGGVSVDELAHELELTGATVRRHLDVLLRDDYVGVTQARGRTGRPRHLFSLTEAGEELFPHHYVRLTHRLLEEIVALAPGETAGRAGSEIANLVFEKMSDRLAREYASHVSGRTLEERARSAVELMRPEGIDFDVEPAPAGATAVRHPAGRALRRGAGVRPRPAHARGGPRGDRRGAGPGGRSARLSLRVRRARPRIAKRGMPNSTDAAVSV